MRSRIFRRELPRVCPINTTLKRRADVRQAVLEAIRLQLPLHPDPPKTWDSLGALYEILSRTTQDATVLDAGAETYSCILPWLQLCGYRFLRGNNLAFDKERPQFKGSIVYEHGNLTQTSYAESSFDAVTCMSVVEHGVAWSPYFEEMARILKPGGLLVTSTDYFEQAIDTRSQWAFGVPIRIFTKPDMLEAFAIAERCGLRLTSDPDLSCEEKAITWREFDLSYTFLVFSMTKGN